jgi:hypothetical protein
VKYYVKLKTYPESVEEHPYNWYRRKHFAELPTALGYGLDDRRFEFRQELAIFLLATTSRPA